MRADMTLPWWAWAMMGAGLIAFIAMLVVSIRRHGGIRRPLFASPYARWMILFTVLPVILIGYYAFTDANGALTLDNFRAFWDSNYASNKVILDAMGEAGAAYVTRGTVNVDTLGYSLWMAFECTLICLVLGYPAALFMADRNMKLGPTLVVLFKGVHYEMMIDAGEHTFKVHSTSMQPQGSRVGLSIVPFNIHIMKPMEEAK